MNAININACFLLIYAAVFIQQCVSHRQWLWLNSSIALWLVCGVVSEWFFPGWAGPLHWGNLFLCHFYVFAGSLIALLNRRQYRHSLLSPYLDLLWRSGVVLHISWLILLGAAYYQYPKGMSVIFASGLIQQYLWQPAFWLGNQWLLMLIWWLADLGSASKKRQPSWQTGLLLAILWQAAYGLVLYLRLAYGFNWFSL